MLVFTGAARFAPGGLAVMPGHADLVAMVPPFVPFPGFAVYATGVLELGGALALVLEPGRRAAGLGSAVLFVVMLPANVYAALKDVPLGDAPATPLWFRVPEQILFIAVALWAAAERSGGPDRAGQGGDRTGRAALRRPRGTGSGVDSETLVD
ncbi:hypothetical protein GCM10010182_06090 [Actinomadura cremea]|nr:hypothetical protein GCM10010182_06090 [Actinomadura cremea]